MEKEINHWCVLCGKGYHACDTCSKEKSFTPWRALTDSIEHYKIFMVLKDYNNKLITKDEAKKMLANVNLADKDTYKENVKSLLKDIFEDEILEAKSEKRRQSKYTKKISDSTSDIVSSENNYE